VERMQELHEELKRLRDGSRWPSTAGMGKLSTFSYLSPCERGEGGTVLKGKIGPIRGGNNEPSSQPLDEETLDWMVGGANLINPVNWRYEKEGEI